MQDINRVVLIGRLVRDPELRKTQNGTSVCSFTVAVNRRQNQDGTQEADFIQCVAWNKLADNIQLYQRKGNQIGVEGRISTRSYDNQQGQRVYVTEVVAENVEFLTPRNDSNEQNVQGVTNTYDAQNYAQNQSYGAQTRGYSQSSQQNVQYAQSLTQQAEVDALEIASDDLPF